MILSNNFDKIGTIGLFITAIFSPCCFPLFAFAASALGLGSFELFGGATMWVFQCMILISIAGLYISYRKHQCLYPLVVAISSELLILASYFLNNNNYGSYFMYAGMVGLLIATIWNYKRNKIQGTCNTCSTEVRSAVILNSTITCPKCQYKKVEVMSTNSCQFYYECENCKEILKPLIGDCCVFCSYGNVKCPPIQQRSNCC